MHRRIWAAQTVWRHIQGLNTHVLGPTQSDRLRRESSKNSLITTQYGKKKEIAGRSWPAVWASGKSCEKKEVEGLTSGSSDCFYKLSQGETTTGCEINTWICGKCQRPLCQVHCRRNPAIFLTFVSISRMWRLYFLQSAIIPRFFKMRDPFLSLSKSNKPEVIIMDEWTAKLGFTTGCDIAPKKTKHSWQQQQAGGNMQRSFEEPYMEFR